MRIVRTLIILTAMLASIAATSTPSSGSAELGGCTPIEHDPPVFDCDGGLNCAWLLKGTETKCGDATLEDLDFACYCCYGTGTDVCVFPPSQGYTVHIDENGCVVITYGVDPTSCPGF